MPKIQRLAKRMRQQRESGDFAKGLAAGIAESRKLQKSQQAKQPSIADIMMLKMLQNQQTLLSPQEQDVVGAAGQQQVTSITPGGQFTPQTEALLSNQPFSELVTSPVARSVGAKPSLKEEARLDVATTAAKQRAQIPGKVAEKEALGEVELVQEVKKLRTKEGEEVAANTLRALASTNVLGNVFLNRSNDLMTKYDIKPGIGQGLLESLPSNELSQYKEAFEGSGIENAAQWAAVAIPGARAERVVRTFAKSGAGKYSTIESGMNNMAASWQSAIAKDIVANPKDYGLPEEVSRNREALLAVADAMSRESAQGYKDRFSKRVYRANPDLFSTVEERDRAQNLVASEDGVGQWQTVNGVRIREKVQ